jgi:uncharacterized protein YbjT (DUF2867 family)
MRPPPRIAVFGASGLIGAAIAEHLAAEGREVVGIARHFTPAQAASFPASVASLLVGLDASEMAGLLNDQRIDVIVNCVGALQVSVEKAVATDSRFMAAIVEAMQHTAPDGLVVHLSVPGQATTDPTAFSRSKRRAEAVLANSGLAYAILRPGLIIAPNAYGGSALLRGLAAWPIDLPKSLSIRACAVTAIGDLCATVDIAIQNWQAGQRQTAIWDVLEALPSSLGDVARQFQRRVGGPARRVALPEWSVTIGAWLGDMAGLLGWSPPLRSTAIAELRRGISGDPAAWTEATGRTAVSAEAAASALNLSVQERWFSRLFLLKPLVLGGLAVFWIVSGLVPLAFNFSRTEDVLTTMGLPASAASALTIASSLLDIAIGVAISCKRTAKLGLQIGIVTAIFYLIASVPLAPQLWADPLGAMVKVVPAVLLMSIALAILDGR